MSGAKDDERGRGQDRKRVHDDERRTNGEQQRCGGDRNAAQQARVHEQVVPPEAIRDGDRDRCEESRRRHTHERDHADSGGAAVAERDHAERHHERPFRGPCKAEREQHPAQRGGTIHCGDRLQ